MPVRYESHSLLLEPIPAELLQVRETAYRNYETMPQKRFRRSPNVGLRICHIKIFYR